jgi:hypothetical protein
VTDDASVIRARAASVLEAGTVLSSSTIEERAHWLAEAATALAQKAHEGRAALSEATGLSIPMIEWATRTTVGTVAEDAMLALAQDARKAIESVFEGDGVPGDAPRRATLGRLSVGRGDELGRVPGRRHRT